MKKKVLLVALALILSLPISLSAKAFDFNIGATAQYQNIVTSVSDLDWSDLTDVDNYRFGAEMRFNFLLLEITNTSLVGTYNGMNDFNFTNHLAAGVYFDVLDFLRLGLDVGPEFSVNFTDSGIEDNAGNSLNLGEALLKSNCNYKAHGDILLGNGLTLSLSYTLPTTFNLSNLDYAALIPKDTDFASGRYGVSLLFF